MSASAWPYRLVPEEIKGTEYERPFRAWAFASYIKDEPVAGALWQRMLIMHAQEES